jgi:beta-lactam-binding protein with PASTA domain
LRGSPPDHYIVPDLRGKSLYTAKILISNSGLRLGGIRYEYYPDLMINTVMEQSLTEEMPISFPSKIDLILSTDKEP